MKLVKMLKPATGTEMLGNPEDVKELLDKGILVIVKEEKPKKKFFDSEIPKPEAKEKHQSRPSVSQGIQKTP